MHCFIAAAPTHTAEAANFCPALAHGAYRIGADSTLLRHSSLRAKGGLLLLRDHGAPIIEKPEALCAAAIRECGRQGFSGVVLDLEPPPRQDRLVFAQTLGSALAGRGWTLYLPEIYAPSVPRAVPLISSALSGGNLSRRLQEARSRSKVPPALDIRRLRMDFTLPAPQGEGTPLTAEALEGLMEPSAVFFSPDLCARYVTYARDGQAHLVLFDDAETLGQKAALAASCGFSAVFFMWPEIRDIAGKLCWQQIKKYRT